MWLYPLLVCLLWVSGCQESKDAVVPVAGASSVADAKAEKDKKDKTGQYVDKSVQVTGYEDGRERPTRPKYDFAPFSGEVTVLRCPPDVACIEEPEPDDPGVVNNPPTPSFVTSVGLGAFSGNPAGDIYAIRIIRGNNSSITPSIGHIKIPVDLNKGAGGSYLYFTFSRDPLYAYEKPSWSNREYTYNVPITDIDVERHTQFGIINDGAPAPNYVHMYEFIGGLIYWLLH